MSVEIPVGLFSCVTGVSGSGNHAGQRHAVPRRRTQIHLARRGPAPHEAIEGLDLRQGDQRRPVAHRPHAAINPATYHGLFADPRAVPSDPRRRARGYGPGASRSSWVAGRCRPAGRRRRHRRDAFPARDVSRPCDVCHGRRYNRETLEGALQGRNIEVLDMTKEDGLGCSPPSADHRPQGDPAGRGPVTSLGQSATTLSGGEAQRVKLGAGASARHRPHALHPRRADHRPALRRHRPAVAQGAAPALRGDAGNTVVGIEHNLDAWTADWIVDMGPRRRRRRRHGGGAGHALSRVAANPASHTGALSGAAAARPVVCRAALSGRPTRVAVPAAGVPQPRLELREHARLARGGWLAAAPGRVHAGRGPGPRKIEWLAATRLLGRRAAQRPCSGWRRRPCWSGWRAPGPQDVVDDPRQVRCRGAGVGRDELIESKNSVAPLFEINAEGITGPRPAVAARARAMLMSPE